MQHFIRNRSRIEILGIITLFIMAAFIFRLFQLQVVEYGTYKALAEAGQTRKWVLPAERGEIYMSSLSGPVRVVLNEAVYTVWVDPNVLNDASKAKITEVMKREAGDKVRTDFTQYLEKSDTRYQVIARGVSYRQAEAIKKADIFGIGFEKGIQRVYPEGGLGSQVLGFVNDEGKGQYGIEGALNVQLSGTNGLLKTVADVRNVPLTIGSSNINVPAKNGDNIALTLDRSVQLQAERIIKDHTNKVGADKASMIVLDPSNGHVLAMANYPSYEPEDRATISDISVLNNPIVTTPLEAGSVIKSFTVATGINQGVINAGSTFYNSDSVQVGDRTITNAYKGKTGTITIQTALNWSLNTGMVNVLARLGGGSINQQARDTLYDYFYNKFRFGKKTGIELAGESEGIIVSPQEEQGNAVRYSNMAFGQGMNVTMLQVAAGFSALVNGGVYYEPTIVAGTMQDGTLLMNKAKKSDQILKKEAADATKVMIEEARQTFYAKQDKPGYSIGGKTGTSQVLKNGEYSFEETVATYVGFGGEVNKMPKYVIMVQMSGENMNLHGNKHAMPMFTDMSNWLIDYLKLQPKR